MSDELEGVLYKWYTLSSLPPFDLSRLRGRELDCRTNYIKGYQKRWLVLRDGRLAYYR